MQLNNLLSVVLFLILALAVNDLSACRVATAADIRRATAISPLEENEGLSDKVFSRDENLTATFYANGDGLAKIRLFSKSPNPHQNYLMIFMKRDGGVASYVIGSNEGECYIENQPSASMVSSGMWSRME